MGAYRTEASANLYARACQVMPGGNTRTTVFFRPHPLYASAGQGCYVTDVDGVERIDAINNFTALIHGHSQPEVTEAVIAQIARGTCFGLPTESEIALAELLCDRLPAVEQVRFTNSGTEAVMTAIKAARAYTGRAVIAKCEGAYHGSYDVAEVSQNASPDVWGAADHPASVATSRGTPASVLENVLVLPFNDPATSARLLRANAEGIAGILIDPMPNRAGLTPATPDYLAMLRQVADEIGALLIFDEVISFRIGYHGAQGRFGARPDLTALGKIIGGGFPVGAVGGRADVMAVFDPSAGAPAVPHGGTFTANPVTMIAGLVAMRLMTPDAFAQLDALGETLQHGLEQILARAGIGGQITGVGSLRRIHLTRRPLTDYRSTYLGPDGLRQLGRLHSAMLQHGVIIAPNGLIALSTSMSGTEIERIVEAFERAVQDMVAVQG